MYVYVSVFVIYKNIQYWEGTIWKTVKSVLFLFCYPLDENVTVFQNSYAISMSPIVLYCHFKRRKLGTPIPPLALPITYVIEISFVEPHLL